MASLKDILVFDAKYLKNGFIDFDKTTVKFKGDDKSLHPYILSAECCDLYDFNSEGFVVQNEDYIIVDNHDCTDCEVFINPCTWEFLEISFRDFIDNFLYIGIINNEEDQEMLDKILEMLSRRNFLKFKFNYSRLEALGEIFTSILGVELNIK